MNFYATIDLFNYENIKRAKVSYSADIISNYTITKIKTLQIIIRQRILVMSFQEFYI